LRRRFNSYKEARAWAPFLGVRLASHAVPP
jgi:hypothetical protein